MELWYIMSFIVRKDNACCTLIVSISAFLPVLQNDHVLAFSGQILAAFARLAVL